MGEEEKGSDGEEINKIQSANNNYGNKFVFFFKGKKERKKMYRRSCIDRIGILKTNKNGKF